MFCREQAAHFQKFIGEFDAIGVRIMGVGNGTHEEAREFVAEFGITYPVFSDPSREAFAAAGMQTRFGIGLSTFKHAKRARSQGFSQGRTQGAPFQQGGLLLMSPEGKRLFMHADRIAGGHIPPHRALDRIKYML